MDFLGKILWGPGMIVFFLSLGLYLTFKLRFKHFKGMNVGCLLEYSENDKNVRKKKFKALCNNLSASLGTGNIIGVETSIMLGGVGSIFWMWLTGIIGSAISYAETFLASKYRNQEDAGPMYYLRKIKFKKLGIMAAFSYAIFGVIASFVTGNMIQANVVVKTLSIDFQLKVFFAILIGFMTLLVIYKGSSRIGDFTIKMVPLMSFIFLFSAILIILRGFDQVIPSFLRIIKEAFTGSSIKGGIIGGVIKQGITKGIFSNEAGMGSSGITQGTNQNACEAGKSAVLCVFIDTILMCTITSLLLLVSKTDTNTYNSFLTLGLFGHISYSLSMVFFGFATIIGWYYIGEKCFSYLTGKRFLLIYKIVYASLTVLGGILCIDILWELSDIANLLMMIPNLFAILYFRKEIIIDK